MTALADGTLFLIDAGDLRRVSPDGDEVAQPNDHMGLWADGAGRVYVAAAAEESDPDNQVRARRVDHAGQEGVFHCRGGR